MAQFEEPTSNMNGPLVASLIKRAFVYIEDSQWAEADGCLERALDTDPENGLAYLGKLLVKLRLCNRELLKGCQTPLNERVEQTKVLDIYNKAISCMQTAIENNS